MFELKNVKFSYRATDPASNGKVYSVTTAESVSNSRVSLEISRSGDVFSAEIKSKTPVEILRLSAEFSYDYSVGSRIFLNGYQSWTESREHDINGVIKGTDHIPAAVREKYSLAAYGDYTFVKYSRKQGCMHGFSYGYIRHGIGDFDFVGSLNECDGFTVIRTDTAKNTLTVTKDCGGLNIESGYKGLSLFLGSGSEDEVFDRYFALMGIAPPTAKPVFGYTSWYRHYQDISETVIENDLDGLVKSGIKADVFQIDDGYQTAVGDWLNVDSVKFQNGMKDTADRIKACGMTAGIWLAPFVCEENSELFRTESDMLLRGEDGKPVKCGSNWSGFYALDIYSEKVREYLHGVFDTVINEWGFGLLKLDFLYSACIIPRKDKTRGRVMADAMELLREYTKGAKLLGCGVPMASAFGMVDYCRVGADVSLDWDDKAYMQFLHRERPSTKNTILNSVFRRQLNGRAFVNDPDVFLLRYDNTTMTEEQKRCLAEVNALTGGVLFCSDNFGEYDRKQREILKEIAELRGAKLLSAELSGERLILAIEKNGRSTIKVYSLCRNRR